MIGAERPSGDDTSFAASRNEAEVRALAVVADEPTHGNLLSCWTNERFGVPASAVLSALLVRTRWKSRPVLGVDILQ